MKRWRTSQSKLLVAAIGVVAIGTFFLFTTIFQSMSTNPYLCPAMTETQNNSKGNLIGNLNGNSRSLQFHPIKTVVKPWRGEHNVYAIFALPLQYQDIYYRSQLLVKGTDTPWLITPTDGRKYGATAPEGYFLVIGFFRTRLALLYFVTGKFSELQQPCNWTLYLFPEQ